MLGIIILVIIGQQYFKLAKKYNQKNLWLYPILGIATYYGGAIIIGGVTVGLVIEFLTTSSIDNYTDTEIGFMAMPFGIAAVILLYYILRKKWEKEYVAPKDEIMDIGKSIEELEQDQ